MEKYFNDKYIISVHIRSTMYGGYAFGHKSKIRKMYFAMEYFQQINQSINMFKQIISNHSDRDIAVFLVGDSFERFRFYQILGTSVRKIVK